MKITHSSGPWRTQTRNSAFTRDLVTALNVGMILPQDYADTTNTCAVCGTPALCRKTELPHCGTAALVRELRAFQIAQ